MKIKNASPILNIVQNNVYDYINWLEESGRLTFEEYNNLLKLVHQLETVSVKLGAASVE